MDKSKITLSTRIWVLIIISYLIPIAYILYHNQFNNVRALLFIAPVSLLAYYFNKFRKERNQLIKVSTIDQLTGLLNRKYLRNIAANYFIGENKFVLFIDLDRFKIINDTLGHRTGDIVIRMAAARLRRRVEQQDTLVRLSGDEFIIIFNNQNDARSVKSFAEGLILTLSEPYLIDANELFISASIGISQSPEDGEEFDELLKKADIAMYQAKVKGKNRFVFYTEEMNSRITEQSELEKDLRHALVKGELYIHYQPRIDLSTNEIIGMEALVRWQHPKHGNIPPSKFIPVAEDSGLIVDLGEWVLRSACLDNKKLQEEGFPPLLLSVNISAKQFQPDLVVLVTSILQETGLPHQQLELEITESLLLQGMDDSVLILKTLQDLGIRISIDDFGTGYSSLSYLQSLPVNYLKIDRSFINNIAKNPAITNAIITLGHSLNLKIVAEGIETGEQDLLLQSQRCDYAQGYLYCKPLPLEEIKTYLRKSRIA
jgi:diguanylate cyclase (GGDEF)-like protein